MEELIDTAIKLLKDSKLSNYRISKDTGLSVNGVKKIRDGALPNPKTAEIITQYFGVFF